MTRVTRYEFKGLNKRQNDVVRPVEYASDLQNVELDSSRNLLKRRGYEESADLAFPSKLFPYKARTDILAQTATALRVLNGAAFDAIPFGGQQNVLAQWDRPDVAEYNNVAYVNDTDGLAGLYKYDGAFFYRAGVPAPTLVTAPALGAPANPVYIRLWLTVKDAQGNETQSDYITLGPYQKDTKQVFTIETFDFLFGDTRKGYPNRSFEPDGDQTIGGGNDTITTPALGHNYNINDFVYCYTDTNGVIPVRVTGTTGTTIVVDTTPLDDLIITHTFLWEEGLPAVTLGAMADVARSTGLVTVKYATSSFETTNFYVYDAGTLLHHKGSQTTVELGMIESTLGRTQGWPEMEEIYDTTIIKGVPPVAKFMTMYNNVLVLGGANLEDQVVTSDIKPAIRDSIWWSDLSVGSTVETFAPFDTELVGKTNEGGITGLFASTDALTVFKESQVYGIQGILTGGNFRIRSALSGEIGCVSSQSIQEFGGGCIFMSGKGVYFTEDGNFPTEISDLIEPLFKDDLTGLDLSLTRTTLDYLDEKIYFFIPATLEADDIMLVYDFYYKEWFLHKNIIARGGMMVQDGVLYHANYNVAGKMYNRVDEFHDTPNVAIAAYYASGWDNLGDPALQKDFQEIIAMSSDIEPQNIQLRTQIDWDDSFDTSDRDKAVLQGQKDIKFTLPKNKAKAMRYIFQNLGVDDTFRLSGYELEFTKRQTKGKGQE